MLDQLYRQQEQWYRDRRDWLRRANAHMHKSGKAPDLFAPGGLGAWWDSILPPDLLAEGRRINETGVQLRAAGRKALARNLHELRQLTP